MPQKIRMPSSSRPKSRSEEHTSELQSRSDLVCRLLLEKKKIRERRSDVVSSLSGTRSSRMDPRGTARLLSLEGVRTLLHALVLVRSRLPVAPAPPQFST